MLLLLVAGALYFFGVLMLFARSMLILSNVEIFIMQLLFLCGLYFFVGVNGILKFFTKKGRKVVI